MQGFSRTAPLTRRDAFAWIGIGFFFLIYMAAVTVKEVRSRGVRQVEVVTIGMGIVCGLLFLAMGAEAIVSMAK